MLLGLLVIYNFLKVAYISTCLYWHDDYILKETLTSFSSTDTTIACVYGSNQKKYICFIVWVSLHKHKHVRIYTNARKRDAYVVAALLYRYFGGGMMGGAYSWLCVWVRTSIWDRMKINFILFSCIKCIERGRGTFLINVGIFSIIK